jgi:hydroxymethylpyrimidine pyrophosphatase-like HAD family hydrolase
MCDKALTDRRLDMKRVVVFDLDETLIDSAHRTPNNADGTLNLERYFELKTRENTMQDSLLPLANIFKSLCRSENYIVICTARQMQEMDYEFLQMHGLHYHKMLCRPVDGSENHLRDGQLKRSKLQRLRNLRQFRNLPFVMFDDSSVVIAEMRKIGIACLNAINVNQRLRA